MGNGDVFGGLVLNELVGETFFELQFICLLTIILPSPEGSCAPTGVIGTGVDGPCDEGEYCVQTPGLGMRIESTDACEGVPLRVEEAVSKRIEPGVGGYGEGESMSCGTYAVEPTGFYLKRDIHTDTWGQAQR